jgi:hypothetical protein
MTQNNSEKLVILKTYSTIVRAEIDKGFLESYKIRCILQADPSQPYLIVRLFVKQKDYKKAIGLLKNNKG